jgi:LAS superfamily LD-carboxypeptidase LdcB
MRLFEFLRSRGRARFAAGGLVVLLVAMSTLPGGADLKEELERLRQEQEQVKEDQAAAAAAVDATTAEADELAAALEVLTSQVNAQAARVADAEQRLVAAEARHDAAIEAVLIQTSLITELEGQLSTSAIESFVAQNDAASPILEEADPNKAVRMQSLAEAVTESGVTVADELKEAKEDLRIEQAEAKDASEEAEAIRAELAQQLAELELRRGEQESLFQAAEARLERQLAEAASLAELDQELANEYAEKNAELIRQQAAAAARLRNPAGGSSAVGFPSAEDIVSVRGFWVHKDIAANLDAMLAEAEAAGHSFGGGAYRDVTNQIRLRKAHCGSSEYAIYQMPASQCSPPTARPGQSMHQQGKAIDFTYNGSIISSRSNAGYQWLAANAERYGFYNLPSEPWHWSENGQ